MVKMLLKGLILEIWKVRKGNKLVDEIKFSFLHIASKIEANFYFNILFF